MDYRKLISFGKGGYVISVPKDWVVENKLEKGSFISMEKSNGSLILTVKENEARIEEEKKITIEIDDQDDKFIRGSIISSYLKNYDAVVIKGENLKEKISLIRSWVHNLIAFEIIESSKNKMVLKNFLDPSGVSVEKTLKKKDIIIRSMYIDIFQKKIDLYDNIIQRNNEIGRHHHLILRILRRIIENPSSLGKFSLTWEKLIDFWSLNLNLRNISNEIIELVKTLKRSKLIKSKEGEIFKILKKLNENYLLTMKTFYTKNFKAIDDLRNRRTEMNKLCEELQRKKWDKNEPSNIPGILKNINYSNHAIVRSMYGI